jgi:hypothetical protein
VSRDAHSVRFGPVGGWQATAVTGRLLFAVEKSAEAVLPAGIVVVAGKGRTRSRAQDVRARDHGSDRS